MNVIGISWPNIYQLLMDWQTLIAAIIALISSVFFYRATTLKEEKKRQRNFNAARAFLSESFAELTEYCIESAKVYCKISERLPEPNQHEAMRALVLDTPLSSRNPNLPRSYREVFRDCIAQAGEKENEFVEVLRKILEELQIHSSRLEDIYRSYGSNSRKVIDKQTINSRLFQLAKIKSLMDKHFEYVRGQEKFDSSPLNLGDYTNSLHVLGISPDADLINFIDRAIKRAS
ncbi:hypothetical protein K8I31_01480 [bacterium]|nr:hypothetical protein [bacterium]